MFTAKVDTRVLNRKVAKAILASPKARRVAVAQVVTRTTQIIAENGPKDTNRWVRGWQLAGNEIQKIAGTGIRQIVYEVRPGRFARDAREHGRNLAAVNWSSLRAKWVRRVREMERHPGHRNWKSYRAAVATLQKIGDAEDKAIIMQELLDAEDHGAIVIFGRPLRRGQLRTLLGDDTSLYGGGADYARGVRKAVRLSSIARVYPKPFGGAGRLYDSENWTFADVRNLEPHAAIVEKRVRLARRAVQMTKAAGFVEAGRAYRHRLSQEFAVNRAG